MFYFRKCFILFHDCVDETRNVVNVSEYCIGQRCDLLLVWIGRYQVIYVHPCLLYLQLVPDVLYHVHVHFGLPAVEQSSRFSNTGLDFIMSLAFNEYVSCTWLRSTVEYLWTQHRQAHFSRTYSLILQRVKSFYHSAYKILAVIPTED